MSVVRKGFLDWSPDQDAFGNEGLTVADNVIHDTEGYKKVTRNTLTAGATLNGTAGWTILSSQLRQMGSVRDAGSNMMGAYLYQLSTTNASIEICEHVGGDATGSALTGGTFTLTSDAAIIAFETCELNDYVFACMSVKAEAQTGTQVANGHCVTMPIVAVDEYNS